MKARKIVFRIIYIGITVLAVILILMFLLWVGKRGYEFGYRVFTETSAAEPPGKDVVVLIRSDMSKRDVAEMLEEKGLIKDPWLFLIQYRLTDFKKIEPGTYTLNTSMTVHDMAAIMEGSEEETEGENEDGSDEEGMDGGESQGLEESPGDEEP